MIRFDEARRVPYDPAMPVANRDVAAVQRDYPQIYLACHTRHQRRRSNPAQLTAQESSLLAHLSERDARRAADLARHLGVVPSTMSAALKRLSSLGYIARARDEADGRAAALRLTRLGSRALQAGSVLETARVAAMLATLSTADRARAIEGLALLARAAASMAQKAGDA
jgi:MarR family transcriptional regulator, organic hydroperoxide resistance regulator